MSRRIIFFRMAALANNSQKPKPVAVKQKSEYCTSQSAMADFPCQISSGDSRHWCDRTPEKDVETGREMAHRALDHVENGQVRKVVGEASFWDQGYSKQLEQKFARHSFDNRNNKLQPKSQDLKQHDTNESRRVCRLHYLNWAIPFLKRRTQYEKSCLQHVVARSDMLLSSPDQDDYSWDARMSELVQCGESRRVLEVYSEMRQAGVQPRSFTYILALKACSSLQDLESAKQIHANIVQSGCESDVYVGTMLVDVYAKCGSLVHARHVFDKMPQRDVVSWNAMILGYAQMKKGAEALHLYAQMQQEGVTPDERVFVGALKACTSLVTWEAGDSGEVETSKKRCLEKLKAIHSDIQRNMSEYALFVGTMLVDAYSKCGSLVDARHVFERMPSRNVVTWNAIILGYAQAEEGQQALELYAKMQLENVVPNDRTIVGALKACVSLAASKNHLKGWCLQNVRVLHSQLLKSSSELPVFVSTTLVDAYAKCGSLRDARHVFEKIHHPNVVAWTAIIMGYATVEGGEEALRLYARMQQECVTPNNRTFVAALKACSSLAMSGARKEIAESCLDHVRTIHSDLRKYNCMSDLFVGNMLVDAYAKCRSMKDAMFVFEKLHRRDVVSWTALIAGYAQTDQCELALKLYSLMQQEGVVPDAGAFVGALKACSGVAALEIGKRIHAQIAETGLHLRDSSVASRLIDMYGKCGSMVDAQQVFDALLTRDVVTWSALIAGYSQHGESQLVFELFQRMRKDDIQPDAITFVSLISVCSHMGLTDKGQEWFEVMSKDFNITPTVDHYVCMIDLFGSAGQLDKAVDMALAAEPSAVLWKALLVACRKWCNVELGRQAFEWAVRLDKNDPATYILMSNIYAATQMWGDSKQIDALRVTTCSWKKPAQSWYTDIAGRVHSFSVGCQEHPHFQHIYENLYDTVVKMEEDRSVTGLH